MPTQLTAFIGRETELALLADRLSDPAYRLITITGPGGVGKTRLALQVATALADQLADGVHWVSLSDAASVTDLALAIAHALHLRLADAQDINLVRKSLLFPAGSSGRYAMHGDIRYYAAEKLAAQPASAQAVHARHAAYFADLVHQRENTLRGRHQRAAQAEIEPELQNVLAAWEWAIAHGDETLLTRLTHGLFAFYESRCWFREGAALFQPAIERMRDAARTDPTAAHLLRRLLARQAVFYRQLSQYAQALDLIEEGLSLPDLPADEEHAFCSTRRPGWLFCRHATRRRKRGPRPACDTIARWGARQALVIASTCSAGRPTSWGILPPPKLCSWRHKPCASRPTMPGACSMQKPSVFQTLTGVTMEELFLPVWEQLERERLNRPERKRAIGGGRKYHLSLPDTLLMTLLWLRRYWNTQVLAFFFGVDKATVSRNTRRVLKALELLGEASLGWSQPPRKGEGRIWKRRWQRFRKPAPT